MTQFPSMPLFAGDMLADTEHLTNEEFGVYHRLLYAMWRRNGWIPDDDRDLARICHLSQYRWQRMKSRMLQFLICEDDELSQKKLLKVRANCENLSTKNRQNINKRWHPDSNEINNMTDTNVYTKSIHRARDSKTRSKKESSEMVAPSFRARSGNGSAASAGSPGCEGRLPAPLSEAKPPGTPSEILSDEEIAAIKKRLSFTS
jgi:uncharacterized protein YdaU (DUF1376 family)